MKKKLVLAKWKELGFSICHYRMRVEYVEVIYERE